MNKNLDLTKILKGLEGIELWSSLMGEKCILKQICPQNEYDCIVLAVKGGETREEYSFKKDGSYGIPGNGECLIFPSKDQRDWSKFQRPIERGTPVVCSDNNIKWYISYYSRIIKNRHYVTMPECTGEHDFKYIILFNKFDPLKIRECVKKYNLQTN